MGRRRWINYGSQNLRKDTVVSSPGFLSASCIPGLELKKPATERNAERWRQNNSDNNSSSSNETQLKQKEKSALSNVRIKNDKTEKVLCMTALLQPSNLDRKKKKKKKDCGLPAPSPPLPPLPPRQASEHLAGNLEFHVLLAETGATFPSSPHPWKSNTWRFWNYTSTWQ